MKREEAYRLAVDLWETSAHLPLHERLRHAKQLAELDVFSLVMVARIARLDPKTLRKRGIKSYARGGRFDPEALTALQELAEQFRLGKELSKPLIRLCVQTGCSRSAIARLIGIQTGKVYRMLEEV